MQVNPYFTDDFEELSIQTDKFARTEPGKSSLEPGSAPAPTNLSPTGGLTNSSRSSSYSSIVSNGSGDPKGFNPFGETAISSGLSVPVSSPSPPGLTRRNAWGSSSSTPTTPVDPLYVDLTFFLLFQAFFDFIMIYTKQLLNLVSIVCVSDT